MQKHTRALASNVTHKTKSSSRNHTGTTQRSSQQTRLSSSTNTRGTKATGSQVSQSDATSALTEKPWSLARLMVRYTCTATSRLSSLRSSRLMNIPALTSHTTLFCLTWSRLVAGTDKSLCLSDLTLNHTKWLLV